MAKFLVLYKTPVSVLEDWMKTDAEERKDSEEKMQNEWNAWMEQHTASIIETAGAGKTKSVTKNGIEDIKNDIMLYSLVEAESQDAVAKMFEDNPHLQIPESSIEIMPANSVSNA